MVESCETCGDGVPVLRGIAIGTGCGIGTVVGPDSNDPQSPYVVVAEMTSPSSLALLAGAAAVVTDQGGILSHAAVVARELDLPCVVGTVAATSTLRPDEEIVVCGIRGVVLRRP